MQDKDIEKNPEFKGKFRTRQNIIEHFIDETGDLFYEVKDVEEIIDKNFVRKTAFFGCFIDKQKVKDAINKAIKKNSQWANANSEITRICVTEVNEYLLDLKKELKLK